MRLPIKKIGFVALLVLVSCSVCFAGSHREEYRSVERTPITLSGAGSTGSRGVSEKRVKTKTVIRPVKAKKARGSNG